MTDYYVDPSLGVDTGDGLSHATRWGRASGSVLQYAWDNIIRNAITGDRILINSAAHDVLPSTLLSGTYGTPTASAPLIMEGYTTVAGDGTHAVSGINGNNGGFPIYLSGSADGFIWKNLELYNCGSASHIFQFDNNCHLINCILHGCDGYGLDCDDSCSVQECLAYDIGGDRAFYLASNGKISDSMYIQNGSRRVNGFAMGAQGVSVIERCIAVTDVDENGIFSGQQGSISNSTVIGNALGTPTAGYGINASSNADKYAVEGNIVQGCTTGFSFSATGRYMTISRNASVNNNSDYVGLPTLKLNEFDNEVIAGDVFSALGDLSDPKAVWAAIKTRFAPDAAGNIQNAFPNGSQKGAIQVVGGGGGGGGEGNPICRTRLGITI